VNANEFVDFPRPIFSNIVYIGGLGIEKQGKNAIDNTATPLKVEN
jgi:hypothetical protein